MASNTTFRDVHNRCNTCQRDFTTYKGLRTHQSCCQKTAKDLQRCCICLKASCNSQECQNRDNELYYKCPHCPSVFTAIKGLEYHLPTCRGPSARKSYSRKGGILCVSESSNGLATQVISAPPGNSMYVCLCRTVFVGEKLMQKHVGVCPILEKPQKLKIYACEICNTFETCSKEVLFEHKLSLHPVIPQIMILPNFGPTTLRTDCPSDVVVPADAIEIPRLSLKATKSQPNIPSNTVIAPIIKMEIPYNNVKATYLQPVQPTNAVVPASETGEENPCESILGIETDLARLPEPSNSALYPVGTNYERNQHIWPRAKRAKTSFNTGCKKRRKCEN